jgi:hypothetical protein
LVLRLISYSRSDVSKIRGWVDDYDHAHLLVSAAGHASSVGYRKRISHVLSGRVGGDIGVLGGMREGLALVVIVRAAHLRDRWRERRAHVLLLRLESVQRAHAGEGERAAAARRACAVWFTNLLVVGGRVVVLGAGERRRGIRSRAGIADGLARLAA